MSLKLKALGLSVIAAMAVSAVAVMNASANEKGHFVSEVPSTAITGFEGPGANEHRIHFVNHGGFGEGQIGCDTVSYKAQANAATVTSLTVTPSYSNCYTTGSNTKWEVHENGCTYTFTVAEKTTNNTEQTAHLFCDPGKKIEITHPLCTISVHPQTINTGITYTHVTEGGKNAITLDVNIAFNVTRHAPGGGTNPCLGFLATNAVGTLKGSATVKGFNAHGGNQVSITAT